MVMVMTWQGLLARAAHFGRFELVKFLIEECHVDVNEQGHVRSMMSMSMMLSMMYMNMSMIMHRVT